MKSDWSPGLVNLPADAPAVPNHSRTGVNKDRGPQTARIISCEKSKWHKARPENEPCPECDPPKYINVSMVPKPTRAASWWVNVHAGVVYDLNTPGWEHYKANPDYFPLRSVKAYTVEAKRVCGCSRGGPCQKYRNKISGNVAEVHFAPYICRDDEWEKV